MGHKVKINKAITRSILGYASTVWSPVASTTNITKYIQYKYDQQAACLTTTLASLNNDTNTWILKDSPIRQKIITPHTPTQLSYKAYATQTKSTKIYSTKLQIHHTHQSYKNVIKRIHIVQFLHTWVLKYTKNTSNMTFNWSEAWWMTFLFRHFSYHTHSRCWLTTQSRSPIYPLCNTHMALHKFSFVYIWLYVHTADDSGVVDGASTTPESSADIDVLSNLLII